MKIKTLLLGAAAMNLCACATVTKGSNDDVKITSTPDNAFVTFEDTAMKFQPRTCTTPCDIELPRKQTYKTTVEKEGYEPFVYMLTPKVSSTGAAGMAGNVLIGGIVGAAIDGSTGAMKDLHPDPIEVTLSPAGTLSTAQDAKGRNVPAFGMEAEDLENMADEGDAVAAVETSEAAG